MDLDPAMVRDCVRRALDEDLGESGDLTARLSVPEGRRARARIVAKAPGVLAGLAVAAACLHATDEAVEVELLAQDGGRVEPGEVVLRARGSAHGLLAAERTALNFLQRLSGVATATRRLVAAIAGTGASILDTRKTTPGLRALEKYAVAMGGGRNHRFGLFDQVLIKENHFALAGKPYEDVVRAAVAGSTAPVIAEARDRDEAIAAVRGGAGVVLLDNFVPGPALSQLVADLRAARATLEIEASGGVSLDNVAAFAACGVDRISIGAITHSAPALDLSMLVEGEA